MQKIRISHINPTDIQGGASLAGYRLHKEFLKFGIDSVLFVNKKYSGDREVKQFSIWFLRIIEKVCVWFGYLTGLQYVFSINWLSLLFFKRFWQTDVFIVRMIHGGYLPLWLPWFLSKIAPVIWRMPDMWAFTPRCAYSYDCPRNEYPQVLIRADKVLFKLKKFFYSRADIYVVCPSRWLEQEARQSGFFKQSQIFYIPTGVNPNVFKPSKKQIDILAIRADKRKGKELFPEIIDKLDKLGKKVVFVENLNEKQLAQQFAQSKVFILPSLADNLPNTLLESLASATPAVVFDVGGCSDVIKHMQTGYLAQSFDINDFVKGVMMVLENYQEMGKKGREMILDNFTLNHQTQRYLALIKQTIEVQPQ